MQLTNAMQLMEDVQGKLGRIPGKAGKELKSKLDKVLKKNPGFDHIKAIAGVLSGTATTFPEGMGPREVAMFKYFLLPAWTWRDPSACTRSSQKTA